MENLDCALAHLGKELVHQTGGEERHGLRPGISHYLALEQVDCTLVGRFVSVGVGGGASDRISPQRYLWTNAFAVCN